MSTKTIWENEISPYKLLIVILVIAVIFMSVSSLIPRPQSIAKINNGPWIIASGLILFYALANSVLSISAKKRDSYWMHSMIAFAILLVSGSILARLFSGISMDEAGTFRWIYFVFTFGYLVFLSIVNLIRFLVELAQRKDKQLRGED
ncbi:MAG: hypothetical protein IPM26_06840 [Saprospiraceae bacterium]|nr:hypothetical protein [Saprospiraceae bacterium]